MPTIATTTTTATMTATVTNLSSPADSFIAAWCEEGAQSDGAQSDPAPCIRGVCDHQASGSDSFDDLCDEWERKALHRLVWLFSSAASKGHQYGSKRHVRLTLRDTLWGPKLCGPKLQ
jgi:hypothetical protein